jgi:ParB family transcriptional regulator, chromosome partitioning protein
MPPKGRLRVGSNIGIDKERAYQERIAELQRRQVREVPLILIDEVQNVRRSYDKEGIAQLASSIKEKGLIHPVVLSETGTRFGIQTGHRRVLACRLLNWETISAIIKPAPEDLSEIQLVENIQREDLSPADLEAAVRALVERVGSQDKAARLLLKSKQWVSNILAASRVRQTVGAALEERGVHETLPSGHLREIASLPPADQKVAAQKALDAGAGKRQFREAAARKRSGGAAAPVSGKEKEILRASLVVVRSARGGLWVNPMLSGPASHEVKGLFDRFCTEARQVLSAEKRPSAPS